MVHLNRGNFRYQLIKTGSVEVSVRLIISVHYIVIILGVAEADALLSPLMFYTDYTLWVYQSCTLLGFAPMLTLLVALQRDDNVGPHNTQAAQKKAYTALSTKSDTRELAKKAASNPETQNLNTVPQLLLLGGGGPIKSGNMVIGAIGVAGMGGPADDQHCAQEAIKEVMGN